MRLRQLPEPSFRSVRIFQSTQPHRPGPQPPPPRLDQQESKQSMATSALYQSIELLSREKGIEPEIVVGAVEEAIALATRKFYKTQENMRGELNKETGAITAYIYKTVVADDQEIEDPLNQITLSEA